MGLPVFYELLTDQPPFEGRPTQVMRAVMDEQPTAPSEIADVPAGVDEILTALAKKKDDRYEAAVDDSVDVHRIGNLQLLEKDVNNPKGDKLPLEWFDELTEAEIEKYRRINCFPDTEPNKENYTDFVEAREEQIRDYLVDKYVKRPTDPAVQ